MSYAFQAYPAHRHGPNGALRVVSNVEEDAIATAEGFRDHPSKIGKPADAPVKVAKPADAPKAAAVNQPKPAGVKKAPKAEKPAEKPPEPTPLEAAVAVALFDRAAAIATLEQANFDVEPDTTDDELKEALAELAKG
jgi:hypothetical protein